jgi:hypothetical protein
MKKSDLLAALKAEREQLLKILEGLPDEAYLEPGVVGDDWTLKDLLSHLTAWESELVTLVAFTRRGQRPKIEMGNRDVETLNAKWHAAFKDRPLDRVLADFHGVRQQTLRQVESLTDEQLAESKKYPWLKEAPLWKWIAEDSFEHDREHAEDVRKWLEQRKK